MMLIAAMLAVPLAPGCRAIGGAVRCELAAATPLAVARAVTPPPPPPPVRRPRRATVGPPGEAEIGRRLLSLTSIGDCTGARTFLLSIGKGDRARAAFAECVGAPETAAR